MEFYQFPPCILSNMCRFFVVAGIGKLIISFKSLHFLTFPAKCCELPTFEQRDCHVKWKNIHEQVMEKEFAKQQSLWEYILYIIPHQT